MNLVSEELINGMRKGPSVVKAAEDYDMLDKLVKMDITEDQFNSSEVLRYLKDIANITELTDISTYKGYIASYKEPSGDNFFIYTHIDDTSYFIDCEELDFKVNVTLDAEGNIKRSEVGKDVVKFEYDETGRIMSLHATRDGVETLTEFSRDNPNHEYITSCKEIEVNSGSTLRKEVYNYTLNESGSDLSIDYVITDISRRGLNTGTVVMQTVTPSLAET